MSTALSSLRSITRPVVLATTAVLSLSFLPSLSAQPCESLLEGHQRRDVNLGSGWTLPIVANPGHLPEDVVFTALGATETAFRFLVSGRIEILFGDGERVSVGGISSYDDWNVTGSARQHQRWITDQGNVEVPSYGALESALSPELSVVHRASSRLLRSTYSGDWGQIRLDIDGLLEVSEPAGDDSIELRLADRNLRLFGAAHDAGRIPFILGEDGQLLLDPEALAEVETAGPLEVVLQVAPYFHGYDAVASTGGGSLAVSNTVGATSYDGRDILYLHRDADGQVLSTTVLASSGDDVGIAITRTASGDVYLAGRLGAPDLAITPKDGDLPSGAFLVRLSEDGLPLGTRSLAKDGITSLHDLAVDAEDRLMLSGRAAEEFDNGESSPLPMTVTLPMAEADATAVASYVVQELDLELRPTGRQSQVETVSHGIRLEVRPGCDGILAVGPKPVVLAQTSCTSNLVTDTYQASNPNPGAFLADAAVTNNAFTDPWGYHALRWKHETQPAHAYTPPNVAPFLIVDNNDHTHLDNLERNTSVFATEPGGTWLLNTTLSPLETAIGAALYMDFWDSPSYANLELASELAPRPAALMEVEFCVDAIGNNNSVVDYCADSAASVGIFTTRYPIDEIDRLCGFQYGGGFFFLRHVDIDHWVNGTNFTQNTRLQQPLFNTAVADAGTLHQDYIADPPDGGEAADAFIHEVSQRLSGHMTEPVATRTYQVTEDGEVLLTDEGHGLVAALPSISQER